MTHAFSKTHGPVDSVADVQGVTPCFTPGTMIATDQGEVPAQHLKPGDRVITRDNGVQRIQWVGKNHLFLHDFQASPHLLPIVVRQGSLGKGIPERDMMVSPNHRILVASDRTTLSFSEPEVLVAAKHLMAGQAVQTVESSGTTYIHFMFERHEVILSDGAWTESFQPDDHTLKGMGNSQRLEILELFPDLKTAEGRAAFEPARRTLSRDQAADLRR
ncbi:MAG: Hint domain-containing protein [Tabrizicola sp.]|nr:Hint domain-containing protein [Tabrizicola sp.]